MKKILVIDGNNIINRAFFGIRPLTTKSGKNTNAIYGMINIISKQLDAIKPDYAAVAFDLKKPTFRHEMFSEYKAGRHATPPELLEQFPDAKECLKLLGLNILELEGYEADDIQGTVAGFAHSFDDVESFILSGDRDLLQLIDDKVTVLLVGTGDTKTVKREEFREKWGVEPEQFVDMKALMGDSSDNIPGVRGIGEKTAAALISNFGSLEGIYENIEDKRIAKGVRAKLEADRDNAFLSRKLSRIITDAPLGKDLSDLEYTCPDYQGLYKKFTELELFSFITKFRVIEHIKAEEEKEDCDCKLSLATDAENNETPLDNSEAKLNTDIGLSQTVTKTVPTVYSETALVADREKINSISADTLSILTKDGKVYISDGKVSLEYTGSVSEVAPAITGAKKIICYHGKTLIKDFLALGIKFSEETKFLDLDLYAYTLFPGVSATLESLIAEHLNYIVEKGAPCPKLLFDLENKMREAVNEAELAFILDEIEIPLLPILADIEKAGFKIDRKGMLEYAEALDSLAKQLQESIYEQAGGEFNINSPKQLGEVLFVKLGLPYKKKNNKNGFSTDADTLEELRPHSPIIDDILEFRQVVKLRGTYAAALPLVADGEDRIHTDFKQTLTATGRLSSAEPNLQNIPIRTKMGREMRRYFIADEGNVLVDADYSQIELRLLAHISRDYSMTEAFMRGADIHRKTAAAVFSVPEEAVTEEMRKKAKAVNFGIVYGISGFSLSKDIGTTVSEANKYIKNYLMMYPSIDEYLEKVVEEASEKGYTATVFGRRRYIHELNSSNRIVKAFGKRVAMNAPIQGSAADIMKLAMIRVYKRLKAEEPLAKIVMQVHDELVVETPKERVSAVRSILAEEMSSVMELTVPLSVDVTSGKNWLEQN